MYMIGFNKTCSFARNIYGCYKLLQSFRKINPPLLRFEGNPLRIDRDVQFCLKCRVVAPCCDRLKKFTPLCKDLKEIH